jgi:DNA polymerase-3 subunit delta
VFYIFHGDDEFSRAEELTRLRGKLAGGDQSMADLNTSVLDGGQLTLGELRHTCDTIPFMSDRRLVIVLGLLGRLAKRGRSRQPEGSEEDEPGWKRAYVQELAAYLPSLPPKTRLIFVENRTLTPSHPILKLAQREEQGHIRHFPLPKQQEIAGWIWRRTWEKGGEIDRQAANLLAQLVGRDLRMLGQEIEKLMLYADGQPVETDDVKTLVSRARETSIFDMVDAVSRRESDHALQLLHHLLDDGEASLYLLTMLVRQIRILIQVSELRDRGLTEKQITDHLKLHPFVVKKALPQSRNFTMAQLETAYSLLVEADWSIKTGKIEDVLALDLLVVELARI